MALRLDPLDALLSSGSVDLEGQRGVVGAPFRSQDVA